MPGNMAVGWLGKHAEGRDWKTAQSVRECKVKANNMFLFSARMALKKLFVREIYCSSDLF